MYGHARFEQDLSKDENKQLARFRRMGSTAWNTKNGLLHLFMDHTYDSDMIYRVNLKNQTLQFGYSSDCMTRLMDLGNYNKSKGGVFQMTSNNG